jgi:hypothetical protein
MAPRQIIGETVMNVANNIHELSADEMDGISGGGDCGAPNVRQHAGFDQLSNLCGNWQGEGGLSDGATPAANQNHGTGRVGIVNDHRH